MADYLESPKLIPGETMTEEALLEATKKKLGDLKKNIIVGLSSIPLKTELKLLPEDVEKLFKNIKKGDVILVGNLDESSALFINDGSNLTHAMIYVGDGKLVHATKNGINEESLADIISHYETYALLRPEIGQEKAIQFALSSIGNSYDFSFDNKSSDSMYCTELVARSYGVELGENILKPSEFLKSFPEVARSKNLETTNLANMK